MTLRVKGKGRKSYRSKNDTYTYCKRLTLRVSIKVCLRQVFPKWVPVSMSNWATSQRQSQMPKNNYLGARSPFTECLKADFPTSCRMTKVPYGNYPTKVGRPFDLSTIKRLIYSRWE